MSLAEIPQSVFVETNQNPDSKSLSLRKGDLRVTEPKGSAVKTETGSSPRELSLSSSQHETTSIVFTPSEDLDSIAFQEGQNKEVIYAARNGVYVEIGAVTSNGQAASRFDLQTGSIIDTVINNGFPYFESPTSIDLSLVNNIVDVCEAMRNKRLTPSPEKLHALKETIGTAIQTSPPDISHQLSLPLE